MDFRHHLFVVFGEILRQNYNFFKGLFHLQNPREMLNLKTKCKLCFAYMNLNIIFAVKSDYREKGQ